eukprot:scaffold292056_cov17-Tisochrysis_lutea.AAC.1
MKERMPFGTSYVTPSPRAHAVKRHKRKKEERAHALRHVPCPLPVLEHKQLQGTEGGNKRGRSACSVACPRCTCLQVLEHMQPRDTTRKK